VSVTFYTCKKGGRIGRLFYYDNCATPTGCTGRDFADVSFGKFILPRFALAEFLLQVSSASTSLWLEQQFDQATTTVEVSLSPMTSTTTPISAATEQEEN
jgi:hypothetical protein